MSKIIGLAALFAFGAFTGGAFVYTTKAKESTPLSESEQQRQQQLLRGEVVAAEPVTEGMFSGFHFRG